MVPFAVVFLPVLRDVCGEGLAGDLEAIEEQVGAVDVELVGGETGDDFAEGVLEGSIAGGSGELEASTRAAVGAGLWGNYAEFLEDQSPVFTGFLVVFRWSGADRILGELATALPIHDDETVINGPPGDRLLPAATERAVELDQR